MPFGIAIQSRLSLSVTVGRRCFGVLGDLSISSPIIHMRRHDLRIWKTLRSMTEILGQLRVCEVNGYVSIVTNPRAWSTYKTAHCFESRHSQSERRFRHDIAILSQAWSHALTRSNAVNRVERSRTALGSLSPQYDALSPTSLPQQRQLDRPI